MRRTKRFGGTRIDPSLSLRMTRFLIFQRTILSRNRCVMGYIQISGIDLIKVLTLFCQ